MKNFIKTIFLSLLTAALSLTGCDILNIKGDSIDKARLDYTYNDYLKYNFHDIDGTPLNGSPKLLVVPIWFTDSRTYIPVDKKEKVRTDIQKAYFGSDNEVGWKSVKTYYEELSKNTLSLTGVVTPWYECGRASSYFYSDLSGQAATKNLVATAVEWYKINNNLTNMKDFDSDHNGYIDGVMLIYGAPDYGALRNSNASNLWAYCYWLQGGNKNPNNPNPNAFFWASYDFMYGGNTAPSGYHSGDTLHCRLDTHTYIHEMGHMFGLEDYYDYSDQCIPAGGFSMQDLNIGSHDPYSVMALGWANVYVPTGSCKLELNNFQSSHDVIMLTNHFNNSPFDEYLLLELYTPTGLNEFDSRFQYYNKYPVGPSSAGIRLWHVDARLLSVDKETGTVINYATKVTPNSSYVHAMSNTYYKANHTSESYISPLGKDYANYNILQLIRNNKNATYRQNTAFSDNDLFRQGDSFKISTFDKQFVKDNRMNDNGRDSWSFTVSSLSSNKAVISITKI